MIVDGDCKCCTLILDYTQDEKALQGSCDCSQGTIYYSKPKYVFYSSFHRKEPETPKQHGKIHPQNLFIKHVTVSEMETVCLDYINTIASEAHIKATVEVLVNQS